VFIVCSTHFLCYDIEDFQLYNYLPKQLVLFLDNITFD